MDIELTQRARGAFLAACALDVAVRKPGNVSVQSAGHGMVAAQFLASARAAAEPLFAHGLGVGARLEAAVDATLRVAGCNTNLGILLLCAPLACLIDREPTLQGPPDRWRARLRCLLDGLDREDAEGAYRAIAAAHPGGLGRSAEQDVRTPPTVTLQQAMAIAAHRDRIAGQYTSGYADLFETGLPALAAAAAPTQGPAIHPRRVQALFLAYLGRFPDSHIVRKHGEGLGQTVLREAEPWRLRAQAGEDVDTDPAFAVWDASLKDRGLNPGTSADLTVATLFLALTMGMLTTDTVG